MEVDNNAACPNGFPLESEDENEDENQDAPAYPPGNDPCNDHTANEVAEFERMRTIENEAA